jgi:predicted secreted protein
MKRLLPLLLLAPLPALANEAGLCPPGATELQLEASAERDVTNDTLHARLVIEREGLEPAALAEEVNQLAVDAMQAARAVPALRLTSGGYRTQPVYAPKDRRIERWQVRHELLLESRDFPAAMRFAARQQERMGLDGLWFGLSAAARAETETLLMQEAAHSLMARAEALRQTLGRPRVELRRIQLSPQEGAPLRPMVARAMLAETAGVPPLEVEGGESHIVVQAGGIACVLP